MIFRPLRFCFNYVLITIGTIILTMIIQQFVAFDLSSVGTSVIPLLAAAIIEGQFFGRHCEGPPAKPVIWRASLEMTGMVMILSAIIFGALVVVTPEILGIFSVIDTMKAAAVLLLAVGFSWVVLRLGYGMGLRSGLRHMA
ncbi:ABZJ_00895 family protein [Roseobacter sp. YSTF-M11]|uniref:ABZJ_00895 family protein n=1 Tax=Roseobacter insulae TaxID=2859783 RepID=A0A9X1FTD0_9RHOB|nr:ABZJ_00895 family protein [Roseobacter insulae]MBW4707287.1 ABZJ_00895 family protein [Roseobacter insulae]